MTDALSRIQNIEGATLPERYVAAQNALTECSKIDECKEWHDKAAAMASYARQARDEDLERLAQRIRGRAARRLGELIRAQKATVGLNRGAAGVGPIDLPERKDNRPTLAEAGISHKLSHQAQRIADLPEAEFEAAIESDEPPSVTALAERGREILSKPRPSGFKAATEALGILRRFAEFCRATDASMVANGLEESERKKARKMVSEVDAWLDQLIVKLGG